MTEPKVRQQRKDRLTVLETIIHQSAGEEPSQLVNKISRFLDTKEQPFERVLTATESWQPLAPGNWVTKCGMLSVRNQAGKFPHVIPTEEQKAEEALRILEIGSTPNFADWLVLPLESMRGMPVDVSRLQIRCRKGSAKYTVTVFPA